ncbi:pepsin-like aspartic protease [Arenimonas sp.]|uniref:pepsin-like aspartic protease n=1 Tax=Arenimonas sp. TaxID=1872635 RepID=UPI0035B47DD2
MAGGIELETTLAYAQGAYTVAAAFGSEGDTAHLVLDTGSSTLAVTPRAYQPGRDRALQRTPWVQDIRYGGGRWSGPVLRSRLGFGRGRHARAIDDALFALIETDAAFLRDADGLWGLAYAGLDPASEADVAAAPRTWLTPAFSALEEEGVVRNRFALAVGRAVVHARDGATTARQRAADPLNRGTLVLGGGSEQQHLYRGGFQDVRILHDLYYNANLRWLRVGDDAPIPVPALAPADLATHHSNALLDTGSSFLVFDDATYAALLAALARRDPRFPDLVARAQRALAAGDGLPDAEVDLRHWPDLHLGLEAPNGRDAVLRIPAAQYWPGNALRTGRRLCLLGAPLPHFRGQSILGLPLFAGRYAVFDRGAGGGLGVVRFAAARQAA